MNRKNFNQSDIFYSIVENSIFAILTIQVKFIKQNNNITQRDEA